MLILKRPQRFSFRFETGATLRKLYATDASEYQELPRAVAFPERPEDIRTLILYAREHSLGLIPRAAGTSLAGQVVGNGIVVDAGLHLNRILNVDTAKGRVRVQPGVVRNELNHALTAHGIWFGPETSTANRAMIGGMVGNNSCGSNSIVYGSTRDHLIACKGFLSDGTEVSLGALGKDEFHRKCSLDSLEGSIYRTCRDLLGDAKQRELIRKHYPKASIPRRNTGYALDLLMDADAFDPSSDKPFNLCKLIAGSEGTLFFGTEFELQCDALPPPHSALLCAHFVNVDEALRSVLPALNHQPFGVELLDRHILEATKRNLEQQKNRFFVEGDPGAILVVDIRRDDAAEVDRVVASVAAAIRAAGFGYAFPVLKGQDEARVWELRRAGQGLVSNVPGDAKPREVCEDTAVDVVDLADYIAEFDVLMKTKHGKECVYYAHAGSGELHTRPFFDLNTEAGLKTFRAVAEDVAALVKKYNGSLSGEHGDGRLRGEFIPFMVGEACFAMMRRMKETFDPQGIFNPGKIIDTPPMDTHLRHGPGQSKHTVKTVFDFSATQGFLRAAENCNGSGDCRKGPLAGGTMCPSYRATRSEKDTTRARANILRHALTQPQNAENPFDNEEVKDVLDLCLSCKACKSECPSNVDMAKLKAEFHQHSYDLHGVPLRTRLIANFTRANQFFSRVPWVWNGVLGTAWSRRLVHQLIGFHPERTSPRLPAKTLRAWFRNRPSANKDRKVYLFCDEFTQFTDAAIGQKAVQLLERLGYEVLLAEHLESGRTWLSKGLLRKAKAIANENVRRLEGIITEDTPLIGIEPSAILSFRDEYIDLAEGELKVKAKALSKHALMIDEFIWREFAAGRIQSSQFTTREQSIYLHGHCFQKAIASIKPTVEMLQIPSGYRVKVLPSGCCGMAGSFGYEKEHYALSMQIGELVLFPSVRQAPKDVLIAAPGTSCRHQILDGTERRALHPIEILFDAVV